MTRALAALTAGAFLTLVAEATVADHPGLAIGLAAAYSVLAVLAYGWVDRRPPSHRRRPAVAYVAVQLALGYLVFGALPDGWTILGAGIIAASGLYTVYRARIRALERASA